MSVGVCVCVCVGLRPWCLIILLCIAVLQHRTHLPEKGRGAFGGSAGLRSTLGCKLKASSTPSGSGDVKVSLRQVVSESREGVDKQVSSINLLHSWVKMWFELSCWHLEMLVSRLRTASQGFGCRSSTVTRGKPRSFTNPTPAQMHKRYPGCLDWCGMFWSSLRSIFPCSTL